MVTITYIVRRLDQGATWPLLAYARLDGTDKQVVLKLATTENRRPSWAILNELIATLVGRLSGIPTPSPYLVWLDEDTHQILRSVYSFNASQIALCVEFIRNLIPASKALEQDPMAARLCFLDFLLLNADRTENNFNAALYQKRLLAFDYGAALPSLNAQPSGFERHLYAFDHSTHFLKGAANSLTSDDVNNIYHGVKEVRTRHIDEILSELQGFPEVHHLAHVELLRQYLMYIEERIGDLASLFKRKCE